MLGNTPSELLIAAMLLSLAPVLMLSATSFLKLSIIFGILKNALGLQGVPSSAVISTLALILASIQIIPIGRDVGSQVRSALQREARSGAAVSQVALSLKIADWVEIMKPLEGYLRARVDAREREFFASKSGAEVALTPDQSELGRENVLTLLAAFMVCELRRGFTIGFLLYLPFLTVDILVAQILAVVGLSMVNPIQISLPLKLGLFLWCDGWFSLVRGVL